MTSPSTSTQSFLCELVSYSPFLYILALILDLALVAPMAINPNPSSEHDFQDRSVAPIGFHPDVASTGSNLQRNKTERTRLQGLMRSNTITERADSPMATTIGWRSKYQTWMVNEGGKKVFFSVFVFLHFLVLFLGFINYDRKDNSVNARKEFGITFRTLQVLKTSIFHSYFMKLLPAPPPWCSMWMLSSFSCPSAETSFLSCVKLL